MSYNTEIDIACVPGCLSWTQRYRGKIDKKLQPSSSSWGVNSALILIKRHSVYYAKVRSSQTRQKRR